MKEQFPSAARVIIDERDRYLTAMLQATARQPQKVPKSISDTGSVPPVVVAVVGIGHQKGGICIIVFQNSWKKKMNLNRVSYKILAHSIELRAIEYLYR